MPGRLRWLAARAAVATVAAVVTAMVIDGLDGDDRAGGRRGPLPADWHRGFNLTAFRADALSRPAARRALRRLQATGTTDVAIVTQWYMDDARSSGMAPDAKKTPSDGSLLAAMAEARRLGMRVMLKPHVDLRDVSFRGDIRPRDRRAWFAAYTRMVEHHAGLAARGGATSLVVGVELTSMARDEARFRRVIAAARRRFPGRLTFAANWLRGAAEVRFWDALDWIGIDAYMPLTRTPGPTVAQLSAAWRRRWVRPIMRLARRERRPVLFTELGYRSRTGAAALPHDASGRVSQRVQARAYEAAYRVWSRQPGFLGIYWYDWPADDDPASTAPGSFSPAGKLAESVVRRYNGASLLPRSPAKAPPRRSGGS